MATPRDPSDNGRRRPVIGPDGVLYVSITAASKATGILGQMLGRWARRERHGWRYAGPAPVNRAAARRATQAAQAPATSTAG